MRPFVVTATVPLDPSEAWRRVTDWPAHGRFVPFTTLTTTGAVGVGQLVVARTALGRLGFDDTMEIVSWHPPGPDGRGACRLEKRGSIVTGWAELTVAPVVSGTRVAWVEAAKPAVLPAVTDPVSTVAGRLLFGRALRGLLAG